jgi:hypothetical protein
MEQDALFFLTSQGKSIRQIAKELDKSYTTVRYWLLKYKITTSYAEASLDPAKQIAKGQGLDECIASCKIHGQTKFTLTENRSKWRCNRCASDATVRARQKKKQLLVETHGSICMRCLQNFPFYLYNFHHLSRESKLYNIKDIYISPKKLESELEKCVMICANCHAEVEEEIYKREGSQGSSRPAEHVATKRRKNKTFLVARAGGKCTQCGYDACMRALHFHHRDPSEKEFGLSNTGLTYSLERITQEADKCDLLCSNCHALLHGGHYL